VKREGGISGSEEIEGEKREMKREIKKKLSNSEPS
jgi:hypothetical protein